MTELHGRILSDNRFQHFTSDDYSALLADHEWEDRQGKKVQDSSRQLGADKNTPSLRPTTATDKSMSFRPASWPLSTKGKRHPEPEQRKIGQQLLGVHFRKAGLPTLPCGRTPDI